MTKNKILEKFEIYDDLPDSSYQTLPAFINPTGTNQRPDMILVSRDVQVGGKKVIWLIELTSCLEENINDWHERKLDRYRNLSQQLGSEFTVHNHPIEIGSRGYIPPTFNQLLNALKIDKKQIKTVCKDVSRVALECSARIFGNRNNRKVLQEVMQYTGRSPMEVLP